MEFGKFQSRKALGYCLWTSTGTQSPAAPCTDSKPGIQPGYSLNSRLVLPGLCLSTTQPLIPNLLLLVFQLMGLFAGIYLGLGEGDGWKPSRAGAKS